MATTTASTGTSTSPFQISGLGSGVDTASILDALRTYRMKPATIEQNKQAQIMAQESAWMDISARLLGVQAAAGSLNIASTFSSIGASISDTSVAGISADATAAPGSVALSVQTLAQTRKVASNTFADAAAAQNLTGDFSVNGEVVHVSTTDSLNSLAQKINALNANASASVIQSAPGQYRMTLSGLSTGLQDSLSLSQFATGGTSLTALGLTDGVTTTNRYATTGPGGTSATSGAFRSSTATLNSLMGSGTTLTGSFQVNGRSVNYDTSTDTLASLASSINTLSITGVKASVISDNNGAQRLQVTGTTPAPGAPVFSGDTNNLLGTLGMTQASTASANVLSQAQDATFTLDTLAITRPTNTVSDALTGVTLTLTKPNSSATLTFSQNQKSATDAINNFVTAYNGSVTAINNQFTYTQGVSTPPLLGDFTLQQVQEQLVNSVTGVVRGQPFGFGTLQDIGVTLNNVKKISGNHWV